MHRENASLTRPLSQHRHIRTQKSAEFTKKMATELNIFTGKSQLSSLELFNRVLLFALVIIEVKILVYIFCLKLLLVIQEFFIRYEVDLGEILKPSHG